jgi:hypothetical protein
VLELPLNDFHSRASLYPQTIHAKPTINGYVARMPPGTLSYIRSHPIVKLSSLQIGVDPGLWDVERQLGLLAANDVRYVVLRKEPLPPQPPVDEAVFADWRALFGPEVAYEDDEVAVFRTQLAPGQSTTPLLSLGDLGLAEVRVRRTWALPPDERAGGPPGEAPEEWATVDLTWVALDDLRAPRAGFLGYTRPSARRAAVRLALVGPDGAPVAALTETQISPRYPTSRWPEGVLVADAYALALDPGTPAGVYRLQLTLTDANTGLPIANAELPVQLGAEPEPLVPALTEMARPAGVSYGGELRLLGYTTRAEPDKLHLDLYWLAERAIYAKYKFFVHLKDDVTGAMIAQHDGMPRHWSYPTDLWGRGEVYIERIELDTLNAVPGPRHLAVGVYSAETGRLPALGRDGIRLLDDQALLEVE